MARGRDELDAGVPVAESGTWRRALAHRDYRRLFLAAGCSTTAGWAFGVVLGTWVFQHTGSALWVAVFTAARFLPWVLAAGTAEWLGRHQERRALLVRLDVVTAALVGAMAVIVAADGPVGTVAVLTVATAFVAAAHLPTVQGFSPHLVGEADLAAAQGLAGLLHTVAFVLGPALAGVALAVTGPATALALNAAAFAAAAALTATVRARSTPIDDGHDRLHPRGHGARVVRSDRATLALAVASVYSSLLFGADNVLLLLANAERLAGRAGGFGFLVGALGVGAAIAGVFASRLVARRGLAPVVVGCLVVSAAPLAVLAVTNDPAIATLANVVRGVGAFWLDIAAVTALQRALPAKAIDEAIGAVVRTALAAIATGGLLAAALARTFGSEIAMWVLAVAGCVLAGSIAPALRAMDRSSAAVAAAVADVVARLERLGLFRAAGRSVLERMARNAETVEVPDGTVVVAEGDRADAIYVIVEGTCTVTKRGAFGADAPVRTMGPDEWFGELGLIEGGVRTATVTASGAVSLLRIDGDAFLSALNDAPATPLFWDAARTRLRATHPGRSLRPAEPA